MPEGGALARLRRDGVQLGVCHVEDADGGVVVVVHLDALDDLVLRSKGNKYKYKYNKNIIGCRLANF